MASLITVCPLFLFSVKESIDFKLEIVSLQILSQLNMLFSITFLRILFRVNRFSLLHYWLLLNTLGFRFWFLFRRIFNRFTISCWRSFCWWNSLPLPITRCLLLLPLLGLLGFFLLCLLIC